MFVWSQNFQYQINCTSKIKRHNLTFGLCCDTRCSLLFSTAIIESQWVVWVGLLHVRHWLQSLSKTYHPHLYPCHICHKHLYAAYHRNEFNLSEILVSCWLKDLSFVGHLCLLPSLAFAQPRVLTCSSNNTRILDELVFRCRFCT